MIQYAREIAALLEGCRRPLVTAFALSCISAVVDMACMVLLPIFLIATLSGPEAVSTKMPLLAGFVPVGQSYRSLVMLVIAVFVLRGALSLFVASRLTRLSETIRASLIRRVARHYLTCPYQEFIGRSVAWSLTVAGAYTGTFASAVVVPLLRLLLDLLTMLAILSLLLLLEFRVVGIAGMALVGVAVAYYFGVRRVSERQSRRLADLHASFGQQMSRALHAPREVRVFQLQLHFLAGLHDDLTRIADASARLTVIGALPRVLGELTLIGLALSYMAYRTHAGTDHTVMLSQLGILAFAGLRMLPAFAQSMSNVSSLKAGRHVTGLLAKELRALDSPPTPTLAVSNSHRTQAAAPFESIELRNVSFAYDKNARPVLQKISLLINRGESVGVVGPSGAGKSTLGDLLLGLLPPSDGEIVVNGCTAQLDTQGWWQTVGFVPQAVFLSNDTLLRNIAFGVPDTEIDRQKAERVASLAQLDELIRTLSHGLDTSVGDYGVRLSGGQRQRVAIARALYHERQFLVLDEATSALDSETEAAIVRAVAALRGSITTFIIAHRRSTLDSCDVLVEIKNGKLSILERLRSIDTEERTRPVVS